MIEALRDISRSRPAAPKVFKPLPPPQGRPTIPVRSKRLVRVVALIALGTIVGAGLLAYGTGYWPRISATPSVIGTPLEPSVVGLGYLEPVSTVIKIAAPGNPDSARIAELKVIEGDEVEAGQVLAVLDTAEKLAAQVESARAQIELKRLILERQQLEIAYTIELRRSAIERAIFERDSTKAEYERQQTLADRSIATISNLEKRRKEYFTAAAMVREMEAALRRIEAITRSGTRDESGTLIDVAVTTQELAVAKTELVTAQANFEQSSIRAPFKGRILSLKARAGERIGSDGLLEMGSTDRMRAVVEVYQTDISRIRLGQHVQIKSDALIAPLNGTVGRIGTAVKRQTIINNDPATATDSRVVEVHVVLDADTSRQVATLSRLQIQAVFER